MHALLEPALHPHAFDEPCALAFSERVASMLDGGSVAVMMALGHRVGLFDAMAALPHFDSQALAQRTGLAERYVREWLAVMVMGGVVSYRAETRDYKLPPEHAACLTRGAALGNLAVYGQFVALMGAMQDTLVDCLRTGRGTRYDEYPRFHEVMAEDSAQTVVAHLFDHILPLAPELPGRLEQGIDVLDAGCGRGAALIAMAQRHPSSRFVGLDLCADAIAHARDVARAAGLDNVRFEVQDMTDFRQVACFDLVTTFDAVHDQRDPTALVQALHRALRPGGIYLMQDIGGSAHLERNLDFPMAAMLYATSCTHCTPISIGQGGPGLGTMWGWETAQRLLQDAGFAQVDRHVLPHDPMNVWFVARA